MILGMGLEGFQPIFPGASDEHMRLVNVGIGTCWQALLEMRPQGFDT